MAQIALVHDWLTGFRGGEKVLLPIASLFPKAPIHTLFYQRNSVHPSIESHQIRSSFLNHMPLSKTKYRYYLPLFPLAAETLIHEKYDLIISTSHAVAKSIRTRGAKHWCYIHSPMRYVWDRFDDYFGPEVVGAIPSKLVFGPICKALQKYDLRTVDRVGCYVANSSFVKERVKKFYGIDCEVINPPVELERFKKIERNPKDFYLFFSALVPYKKAEHAILACEKLGRPLKILGKGPELKKLKKLANSKWVQFIESPSDSVVEEHYATARALLFPGVEDFGIVPVEASGSGLPVIGYRSGGLLDSQTEQTCEFYDEQTVEGLAAAIEKFETRTFDESVLRKNAERFSEEEFVRKIRASILKFAKQQKLSLDI